MKTYKVTATGEMTLGVYLERLLPFDMFYTITVIILEFAPK